MYVARFLIVGEPSVGKTSLLLRYKDGQFYMDQKTTIGVDYKAKEVQIGGEALKLQIWDTAGQERFRSINASFYLKAQGIIVVFDITDRETFNAVPRWLNDIRDHAQESCVIQLCVNKTDLPEEYRAVSKAEYVAFAQDHGLDIVECSAKSGLNVEVAFETLAARVLATNRENLTKIDEDGLGQDEGSIILREFAARKNKSNGGCCTVS
ncbi:ras-related protein rab-2B-like protein [Ochromonadaceae sp. CCMP2298]|nr:ras-related protein rab-2B-like protein [Ochromonadaceae sp. CCMP2298]